MTARPPLTDFGWPAVADALLLRAWRRRCGDDLAAAVRHVAGYDYRPDPNHRAVPADRLRGWNAERLVRAAARANLAQDRYLPAPLARLMLTLGGYPSDDRDSSLFDPCAGCGCVLLAAARLIVEQQLARSLDAEAARDQMLDRTIGLSGGPAARIAEVARLLALTPLLGQLRPSAPRARTILSTPASELLIPRLPGIDEEETAIGRVLDGCGWIVGRPAVDAGQRRRLRRETRRRWPSSTIDSRDEIGFHLLLGVKLLAPGGQLVYLTDGRWLTEPRSAGLRCAVSKQAVPRWVIDAGRPDWYPHRARRRSVVVALRRGPTEVTEIEVVRLTTPQSAESAAEEIATAFGGGPATATETFWHEAAVAGDGGRSWPLLTRPGLGRFLDRMVVAGVPLGELCEIRRGVSVAPARLMAEDLLAWDDATVKQWNLSVGQGIFVLSDEEVEALSPTPLERRILRPYHAGSAIEPFRCRQQRLGWLIYPTAPLDAETCPNIVAHLTRYRGLLARGRRASVRRWPDDRRPQAARLFDEPKLVAPHRPRTLAFCVAAAPFYAGTDVVFVSPRSGDLDLDALAYVLNSPPLALYAEHRGRRRGARLELSPANLADWPLPRDWPRFAAAGRLAAAGQLPFPDLHGEEVAAAYALGWPPPESSRGS